MKHTSFIKFVLLFPFLVKVAGSILPTLTVKSVGWLLPIGESILYIAIGVFLLRGDNLLAEYSIDRLSLILFILFGTIFRIDRPEISSYEIVFRVIEWLIAGILLFRIVNRKIPVAPLKWMELTWSVIGSVIGILLGLFLAYLIVYEPGFLTEPVDPSQYTTPLFILQIFFVTGKSSVVEEIIFRGLLFGYLAKQNGNEKQSLLIQAVLFWLLHFHYLWISPFSFWVGVPVSTLVFSMLIWRSHSLSSSIMAHVLSNTFVTIFAIVIANS